MREDMNYVDKLFRNYKVVFSRGTNKVFLCLVWRPWNKINIFVEPYIAISHDAGILIYEYGVVTELPRNCCL
jgi:hypothetical protein